MKTLFSVVFLLLSTSALAREVIRCDGETTDRPRVSASMIFTAEGNAQISRRSGKVPYRFTLVENGKPIRRTSVFLMWKDSTADGKPDRFEIYDRKNNLVDGYIAEEFDVAFIWIHGGPIKNYIVHCERNEKGGLL